MNQRIASIFGFIGSVAAATLAAAAMTGSAWAEGPIGDTKPFVGSLSRAEVKAELAKDRQLVTSYASEWQLQQSAMLQPTRGYTREQAQADYIAQREEVRAMTAEHGGSGHFAAQSRIAPATTLAGSGMR